MHFRRPQSSGGSQQGPAWLSGVIALGTQGCEDTGSDEEHLGAPGSNGKDSGLEA